MQINKIIADDESLNKAFNKYIEEWRPLMQTWMQPYTGKFLPSLFKRGLLPAIMGRKKKLLLTNLARCESHRDILIPSINPEKKIHIGMCGFAGYFIFNNKPEKDNHNLSQMMVLQKHRGPDDSGMVGINTTSGFYEEVSGLQEIQFERDVDLLFGFNRLSILDLSPNGHQPMFNQNKNVVLMLNGEVYNAFDYKEELEGKGYRFKSSSDTEVVLYLYEAYGMEGMLKRLNGMFALAIYDFRDKKLRLARDRFGIKPLYIIRQNGLLAFSSEMKSFKALPQVKLEADYSQLDEFLLFRNLIHDTLFKGVHNLLPGTFLEIDSSGVRTKKRVLSNQ